MDNIKIISFGAGVQSTCLVLRCLAGELPKPDAVIFADTGWEPQTVYTTIDETRPLLEAAGIPLLIARKGNIREDMVGV
jgi:3'-phosphoadenosine 5'-phosphosulfate sulfotransferase (PAPS reductase)/FAD synthetase